jgi:hypothetical protein
MINTRIQKRAFQYFISVLCIGLLTSCATSSNRPDYISSIGHEDLTFKKPVNAIVYYESQPEAKQTRSELKRNAQFVIEGLNNLDESKKINVNNLATHNGNWFAVANNYFRDDDYNWRIKLIDSELPEIKFQNYSNDIDTSKGVHFRYCKERTIQFANISTATISANYEYWNEQFYPLALQSLYLLMKGNTGLAPITIRNYEGNAIGGTLLGETENFIFILYGETHIYIASRNQR